jgi:Rha family phage regulatory protein
MQINVYKNSDNRTVTTSLEIARVFGKTHNNVVEDIKKAVERYENKGFDTTAEISVVGSPTINLMSHGFRYINKVAGFASNQKPITYYEISEQVFMQVAMAYNGQDAFNLRDDYIEEFERMRYELTVAGGEVYDVIDETIMRYEWNGKQFETIGQFINYWIDEHGTLNLTAKELSKGGIKLNGHELFKLGE